MCANLVATLHGAESSVRSHLIRSSPRSSAASAPARASGTR